MKRLFVLIVVITFSSCIPLRLAPDFQKKGHKIKEAKKFNRELPKQEAFIFVDSKEEGDFYNFINTKFELYDFEVTTEVPFRIDKKLYYLSFYEVKKSSTSLNLLPMMIDSATDGETDLEDNYVWNDNTWYIVLTVIDNEDKDCLKTSHKSYYLVLEYLKDLKQAYLAIKNPVITLSKK